MNFDPIFTTKIYKNTSNESNSSLDSLDSLDRSIHNIFIDINITPFKDNKTFRQIQ